MHQHRSPVGPMPTRGRIRAAVVVLGLFVGITPFLGGMAPASAAPPPPWTTTITASPQTLWPTQNSTIVVTANGDVGPTPYYIRIYDTSTTTTTLLASCGTGTTCSVSVTRPTPAVGNFQGKLSTSPATSSPVRNPAPSRSTGRPCPCRWRQARRR